MPAPKTDTKTAETDKEEAEKASMSATVVDPNRPQRKVVGGIPGRTGKARVDLSSWKPEMDDLRNHLGEAFGYEGTPNANNLARNLQAEFGCVAKVRNWDKKALVGDLYIEWPTKTVNDKLVIDDTEITAQKEKYSR
jgi:hypothetical protein